MKDPNHIALQATDPDLGTDIDATGENAAGDLMDYASTVATWGEETVSEILTGGEDSGGGTASGTKGAPMYCPPQSVFHSQHQMRIPVIVAAVVVVVILAIVFIPTGGGS